MLNFYFGFAVDDSENSSKKRNHAMGLTLANYGVSRYDFMNELSLSVKLNRILA